MKRRSFLSTVVAAILAPLGLGPKKPEEKERLPECCDDHRYHWDNCRWEPICSADPAWDHSRDCKSFFDAVAHERSCDIGPWIEEGRRIGKAPWCCSSVIEDRVADALAAERISERETAEETIARREADKHGSGH